MSQPVDWFRRTRALSVIEALKKNRMNGLFVEEAAQTPPAVMDLIPAGSSVAMGGSMTLFETGVVEALRARADIGLIDRFEEGIPPEEVKARLKAGIGADVFLAGVNAVTEEGELVFVDAVCNRVAPILYGPGRVILVTGCNKICPNLAYAQERIRHFTAPANAKRLGRKTPCAETGQCADCSSPERICNATVVIHKQADKDRLHVVFVGGSFGL